MDDQVHYHHDPYRSRSNNNHPTTNITSTVELPPRCMILDEDEQQQRANSYLPYSNHPPDLSHAKSELYLNEEQDAPSSPRHPHFQNRLDLLHHDGSSSNGGGGHGGGGTSGVGGPSRSMLSATTMSLLFKASTFPHPVRKEQTTLSMEMARRKKKKPRRRYQQRWCHVLFSMITLVLLAGGLTAFFCWPRIPHLIMDDNAQSLYAPTDWGQDNLASLRATWLLNVTFDNTQNWIPTHIHAMELFLVDALYQDKQFGMATESITLPPRISTLQQMVFHVSYDAASVEDPTFQNLYNACGPKKIGTPSDLAVEIQGQLHIRGLAWSQYVKATPSTGKFLCPTI
ncbi:hypothetical protein BDA99DRAFT_540199 [Phascolomyces articulosus]|uniref:Uncharacterized protein n=1 Tax=Phascolomyces articulosus TaxID=60185 RepID=A0AAD5PAP9_9FUNG|nr:hypothetical protein BDA99DRAFT_540199 [Phascolomyces articulosus]